MNIRLSVPAMIAQAVTSAGVRTAFTVPGSTTLQLTAALEREGISVHLTSTELAAVEAAQAAGEAEGSFGLALLARGPGAVNGMCGLVTACDGHPVLALVGDYPQTSQRGSGLLTQDLDLRRILSSICITRMLTTPGDLAVTLTELFTVLHHGKSAVLVVPQDLQSAEAEPHTFSSSAISKERAAEATGPVPDLDGILNNAAAPVIVFGREIASLPAVRAAAAHFVAARSDVSVAITHRGLSRRPPGRLGILGAYGCPETNEAARNADTLVVVSERLRLDTLGGRMDSWEPDKLIHFRLPGVEPQAVPATEIAVSPSALRTSLLAAAARKGGQQRSRSVPPEFSPAPGVDECIAGLADLLGALPDDVPVCLDSGQNFFLAARALAATQPRTVTYSDAQATMGFAIPAAVGHAAATGRPAVAIVGEGGLMMALGEAVHAARCGLAIKVILLRNSVLGMVRANSHAGSCSSQVTAIPDLDERALAALMGAPAAFWPAPSVREVLLSPSPALVLMPAPLSLGARDLPIRIR